MSYGVTANIEELIALKRDVPINKTYIGRSLHDGVNASKLRGRGMDFSETRNYQAGDDIRHMEWRVTARTGRAHIKCYQEERERPVIILVDFNQSMYFGTRIAFKSLIAARLAAILSWSTIAQGDRLGGLLFSELMQHEFAPHRKEAAILPFLKALSVYTHKLPTKDTPEARPLSIALNCARKILRHGSVIVLISDFYNIDKASKQLLAYLSHFHNICAYHICDPLELSPPKPEKYVIGNGRDEFLLDTSDHKINCAYLNYCIEHITALSTDLKRLQIQYTPVTGSSNLSQIVQQTFMRKTHG